MNKKHVLLCLCLICFAGSSFSQKKGEPDTTYIAWSENQDKIEQAFEKEQYGAVRELVFYNLDRAEDAYSPESPEYRTSIFYLAQLYESEKNYKSAESTYLKTKELFEKTAETKTLNYAILVRQLGKFYQSIRSFEMADSLLQTATNLIIELKGKKHKEYAVCLIYRADLYSETGEYSSSIQLLEQIGKRYERQLDGFLFKSLLIDLGYNYELLGRYADALKAYKRCENLDTEQTKNILKGFGSKNILALVINGQARAYEQLGDYAIAKKKFFQANGLYESLGKSETNNLNYRYFLEDFAAFYQTIGDYKSAEQVYKKIGSLVEDNQEQAKNKNNLGLLYEAMGNYPQAENYYLESKKLFETQSQIQLNQRACADLLSNLGGLYELLGKYKESEKLYLKAKQMDELSVGREHPDYAATLNNLGNLYTSLQDYKKAEEYYKQSEGILIAVFGDMHPNYIRSLSNHAMLYVFMQRYEDAEILFNQVLTLQRKRVGKKHPDYATTLNRMAGLYKIKGDTKKSGQYYEQAKDIRLEILGNKHPDYAITLNEYAQLYHYLGNKKEAYRLFVESNEILLKQFQTIYPILSEQERLRFYSKQEPRLEAFYSFATDCMADFPNLATELENIHITVKGLALEMTINNRNIALNSKNDTLTSMLREWMAVRDRISKVYSASLSDQNTAGLDSLLDMANALEVRLSKASNYFRQRISSSKSKVDFDVLKNSLKKEEAIADFFCFRYFNGRTYTNEVRYYAVLIFPGAEQPQWVKLGDEEQLKKIIDRNVSPQINNYTSSTRVSYQLYRQVWAPLEAFLGNVEKIHLSPAGLLNKISFAALMPDSSYLIDKYELAYHGNLRTFMQKIETDTNLIVHSNDALLMGDPEFNTALALLHPRRNGKNEKEEESESLKTSFPVNLMNTGAKNDLSGYFTDLHGTRTEVIQIQKLLDSLKLKTTIYLGAEVLEEKMQQISENPKPKVMHIATHGYFYPLAVVTDSTVLQKQTFKERMRYAINPLWRSGLVFSGANNTWKGILPPSDVEDGVMMAYEVANLDLFGVDLAVLSACDTGRGDLHNNEGVLGLQRAFKTAGVKHLLISLWRVPDVETSELMYAFYQSYLSGMPVREAFRLAQQKMIKKGYSAFYWAGFVLIE